MSTITVSENGISLLSPLVPTAEKLSTARPTAPALQQRWEQIRRDIVHLRDLGDDWDGQGGSAPDARNIDCTLRWVESMRCWPQALPPSQVVPGVGGEVYLIWQQPGVLLEAEISDLNQVEWMLAVEGQPTRQWQTKQNLPWLVAALANGADAIQAKSR